MSVRWLSGPGDQTAQLQQVGALLGLPPEVLGQALSAANFDLSQLPWATSGLDAQNLGAAMTQMGLIGRNDQTLLWDVSAGFYPSCDDYALAEANFAASIGQASRNCRTLVSQPEMMQVGLTFAPVEQSRSLGQRCADGCFVTQNLLRAVQYSSLVVLTRSTTADSATGDAAWDWPSVRLYTERALGSDAGQAVGWAEALLQANPAYAALPDNVRYESAKGLAALLQAKTLLRVAANSAPKPAAGQSSATFVIWCRGITPVINLPDADPANVSGEPPTICYPTPSGNVCLPVPSKPPAGFPPLKLKGGSTTPTTEGSMGGGSDGSLLPALLIAGVAVGIFALTLSQNYAKNPLELLQTQVPRLRQTHLQAGLRLLSVSVENYTDAKGQRMHGVYVGNDFTDITTDDLPVAIETAKLIGRQVVRMGKAKKVVVSVYGEDIATYTKRNA